VTLVALAEVGRGVVPVDSPVLHADDEGVLRGLSVFETLRVYGGAPFKLDAHLDRLASSAERLHLPAPPRDAFVAAVRAAIAAAPVADAVLRLLWLAGRKEGDSTGLVLVSTLPDDLDARRERGLRLTVLPWSPGALGGVKSTSYAANMLAQDEAVRAGADDALFVSPDGTLLEAPTSNVWFREGERLLTPSLDLPILAGVTRATLLELAPGLGYAVEEGSYGLDRLRGADEAFLTASIREVMPVVAVDGAAIERGPAAAALQTALRGAAGYPEGR